MNERDDILQVIENISKYDTKLQAWYIEIITKHYFTSKQMEQLIYAYKNWLSFAEIKFIANPYFTHEQMRSLRFVFEMGIKIYRVKKIITPTVTADEIIMVGLKLKRGVTNDDEIIKWLNEINEKYYYDHKSYYDDDE